VTGDWRHHEIGDTMRCNRYSTTSGCGCQNYSSL